MTNFCLAEFLFSLGTGNRFGVIEDMSRGTMGEEALVI